MHQDKLIDFPLSTGTYSSFVEHIISMAGRHSSSYICVANVHMFIEAYKDREFFQVIKRANIVTPDGLPLTWGLSMCKGIKQDRVAGMDLLPDLLKMMAKKKLSAFFYGGTPSLLSKTELFLKRRFPLLKLAGFYSPPYRNLTKEESAEIINTINLTNADIVFVVLGCPKQEKWMASMQGKINSCLIGIGGALPVMVGVQKRAPGWMQRAGLEWLFRLCQEPIRLGKRYFVTNSLFIYLLFKELYKNLKNSFSK